MKNTKKEEIRRRMSHGELLRSFNNGNGTNISGSNNGSFNNGFNNGSNNGSFNGSDVQSTNGEEEKTVFFDAQVGNGQIIIALKQEVSGNDQIIKQVARAMIVKTLPRVIIIAKLCSKAITAKTLHNKNTFHAIIVR